MPCCDDDSGQTALSCKEQKPTYRYFKWKTERYLLQIYEKVANLDKLTGKSHQDCMTWFLSSQSAHLFFLCHLYLYHLLRVYLVHYIFFPSVWTWSTVAYHKAEIQCIQCYQFSYPFPFNIPHEYDLFKVNKVNTTAQWVKVNQKSSVRTFNTLNLLLECHILWAGMGEICLPKWA